MLYENKSCLQLSKSAVFADKANLDSPKQILYPVSKFFCGRQQHDYSAGISSFTLALFYTLSMFVLWVVVYSHFWLYIPLSRASARSTETWQI